MATVVLRDQRIRAAIGASQLTATGDTVRELLTSLGQRFPIFDECVDGNGSLVLGVMIYLGDIYADADAGAVGDHRFTRDLDSPVAEQGLVSLVPTVGPDGRHPIW